MENNPWPKPSEIPEDGISVDQTFPPLDLINTIEAYRVAWRGLDRAEALLDRVLEEDRTIAVESTLYTVQLEVQLLREKIAETLKWIPEQSFNYGVPTRRGSEDITVSLPGDWLCVSASYLE
jgi:hypothetical protein